MSNTGTSLNAGTQLYNKIKDDRDKLNLSELDMFQWLVTTYIADRYAVAANSVLKFIQDCKPFHLTIADIKRLSVGDNLKAVIWDMHWLKESEYIYRRTDTLKHDKSCDAYKLFDGFGTPVIYHGEMKWSSYFFQDEELYLDVSSLKTKHDWYQLRNGQINIKECDRLDDPDTRLPCETGNIDMHWTEFPDDTRVGYNGPMMLYDKLADMSIDLRQ
jgi:hypothetical protein